MRKESHNNNSLNRGRLVIETLFSSFTDPGWLDTHTIEWDFGDGTTTTDTLTLTHKYCTKDEYTVTLTETDDNGGVGSDTLIITVIDTIPPEVSAEFIPLEVEEDEGLFEIQYSATDLCAPNPAVSAVIEVPGRRQPRTIPVTNG